MDLFKCDKCNRASEELWTENIFKPIQHKWICSTCWSMKVLNIKLIKQDSESVDEQCS